MKVLLKRCAGLDVHKETVVACARRLVGARAERAVEQFGTTTSELLRLLDWLQGQGCTHAALEATGVYWKPVRQILEGHIELTLANPVEVRNVKLTGIITDLLGASGRAILRALIEGETDPDRLLARTTGRLRAPRQRLLEGLRGAVTDHHRFLLRLHLSQIESLEGLIAELDQQIDQQLEPFRSQLERLTTIPGVSRIVASTLIAEIGTDMSRFPTAGHLISWAGLCPRLHESAGKRRTTRTRKGAQWLKTVLVHAAWTAARTKGSSLQAQYLRLKSRRGPKKADVAVAASMLTAAYNILQHDGVVYLDLGADHFDRQDKSRAARGARRRGAGWPSRSFP